LRDRDFHKSTGLRDLGTLFHPPSIGVVNLFRCRSIMRYGSIGDVNLLRCGSIGSMGMCGWLVY
ncbi:hypothetical protein MJH12_16850, partial [bacterium]|nr:hypothetical protein [bacterium]